MTWVDSLKVWRKVANNFEKQQNEKTRHNSKLVFYWLNRVNQCNSSWIRIQDKNPGQQTDWKARKEHQESREVSFLFFARDFVFLFHHLPLVLFTAGNKHWKKRETQWKEKRNLNPIWEKKEERKASLQRKRRGKKPDTQTSLWSWTRIKTLVSEEDIEQKQESKERI